MSRGAIAQINPNTITAPIFRTTIDAELTASIYSRVPVLINESKGAAGNPWGVSFMTMFHMSNDSGLFRTAAHLQESGFLREGSDWVASEPDEGLRPPRSNLDIRGGSDDRSLALGGRMTERDPDRYVPLYEAKMVHQFDHRWATYDGADNRDATAAEKADLGFEPTPRYWVPESEVRDRLAGKGWTRSWLMGWRDICRSTDERTVIATAFPRVGVGNNLPIMFPSVGEPQKLGALVGCLSSLACDFFARHKVGGTHLNYFIYEQLPVLPPSAYSARDLAFILPRLVELTYTSYSMASFARDFRYQGPPFAWDADRRALLRAELDAWYARAYGLTRDELRYVLDPADVRGPDYPSETEIARYGEYRTARLVLAAWDAQEAQPAAAQ